MNSEGESAASFSNGIEVHSLHLILNFYILDMVLTTENKSSKSVKYEVWLNKVIYSNMLKTNIQGQKAFA